MQLPGDRLIYVTALNALTMYVVVEEHGVQYYLLKVVMRGYDVYCFPPGLGTHVSLHESGQSHFTRDSGTSEDPPMALMQGEAGAPSGRGVMSQGLRDCGRAVAICVAWVPVGSLAAYFREFTRTAPERFVIDKDRMLGSSDAVEIGIWAVPSRNQVSFGFNNREVADDQIYKVDRVEPQLWIYAKPSV